MHGLRTGIVSVCLLLSTGLPRAQEGPEIQTGIQTYQSGPDTVSAYLAVAPE